MIEMKREKEEKKAREAKKQKARDAKNAKNTKNAPTSSSRPSESNINPQPGGGAQAQPTPGLHSAGFSTSSKPAPAVVTRWAHFWSATCCIPAQDANDHR